MKKKSVLFLEKKMKNVSKHFFLCAKTGVTIVIDNKALMALVGTEMDWVEDDLKAEFVFNNPNSKVHQDIFNSY